MTTEQKRILIAEDEKPIAKVLSLKLSANGFEVTIANNGQEAIDKMSAETFDLVLLDLVMPGTDGFAVLEWASSQGNSTPIIVSSNLSQEEDIARAKELGAVDYYVKSDTPIANVVQKVQSFLG